MTTHSRRHAGPRRTTAALATVVLAAGISAALVPGVATASSHREAPLTAGSPQTDNTDLYAFVSPDDASTVTLIADWTPFEEPNGGPNFYPFQPGAHYDINIDSNGDAKPDLTYRWTFESHYRTGSTFLYNTGEVTSLSDPDLNFTQTYTLDRITYGVGGVESATTLVDGAPVAPSDAGPTSMPDYASLRNEAIVPAGPGAKSFAGQADDPFFLDLRVFDLLYGGDLSEVNQNTLNGYNVNSVALQLPKDALALNGSSTDNPVIGVWSTTEVQSMQVLAPTDATTGPGKALSGNYVQVSRLGMPLVNEVVIPVQDKDNWNNSTPAKDSQFADYVTDPEVPRLIDSIYHVDAPATPRADLAEVFLTGVCATCGPVGAALGDLNSQKINKDVDPADFKAAEELRLNMSVPPSANPKRLGVLGDDVAGFPNGRRLTDDVVDIELQALEGALPPYQEDASGFSDGVNANERPFYGAFPYLALPHGDAVNVKLTTFSAPRLAGADRFATAAAIATSTFATADTVVLANGLVEHAADSLSGSYLAGQRQAPVLLTTSGAAPQPTLDAIDALGAQNVVIIGGTSAVSTAQEQSLRDSGLTVTRIAGADRFATSALVAAAPGADYVNAGTALLANGADWPDGLVAGPIAYHSRMPVELTTTTYLPAATVTSLQDLGITKVLLIGGTSAVSPAVESQLTDLGITVTRISGADRTATAVAVADYETAHLGFTKTHVNIARGDVGADAFAGDPHAGVEAAPILLAVSSTVLGAPTQAYLTDNAGTLVDAHVFGGAAAVSDALITEIKAAAQEQPAK